MSEAPGGKFEPVASYDDLTRLASAVVEAGRVVRLAHDAMEAAQEAHIVAVYAREKANSAFRMATGSLLKGAWV